MNRMFEVLDEVAKEALIKVIGVGGCGGNAVDHMISSGLTGVEFICANTDALALTRNLSATRLQLGTILTKGLGAGAKPDVGREAALEDRERITNLIQGTDLVFIVAGMGGGTGTGAAPIVAQAAKEMGVLTVAVVTRPFLFENKRVKVAQAGIEELAKHVNSMVIVPNDKLMEVLGNNASFQDVFKAANSVLYGIVASIADIINNSDLVNVDFADVKTVMSENGMAAMGSGSAAGVDRARIAAERAVTSPLLEGVNLSGARGMLVNITASMSLRMKEVHEVMNVIKGFTADDATVIFGTVFDEQAGDELRVTMVATGLGSAKAGTQQQPRMEIVRTGTDNIAMEVNYEDLDEPAVMRRARARAAEVGQTSVSPRVPGTDPEPRPSGIDALDIPGFLRKQAD